MNLSDMKTIVRRELHDEDASNYRWSDAEIERHISHALKEFGEALPQEIKATIATAAGSREINISSLSSRVMVEAVEYPVNSFPKRYQRFLLWGDIITLLGNEVPDGSNACVYYGKLHTLDISTSTIPARHEDLVASGASGYAAVEWAGYAVNRVNSGGANTPEEFLKWGKDKLSQFRSELRRLGRRNRVRLNQLYKPERAPVSRSTDWGP